VDHIDNNRHNNDVTNLRWVTQAENMHSSITTKRVDNTSGFRGVFYHKKNRNWVAKINVKGTMVKHLGSYATPEEASAAYEQAAKDAYGDYYRRQE
jgi:hypothetical protein